MAERLPSPPLSPLLGQPVERNNNINNMNDSVVVKSNNGQAESEVRRKVTAEAMLSAFFFFGRFFHHALSDSCLFVVRSERPLKRHTTSPKSS